jgi:predicted  nucleic acid-binding Zn-ribbon protein
MRFLMHPDLERLIRLQHAESDLRRVDAELGGLPGRKQALAARVAEERSRLDAARSGLAESQKTRRQLETELQDLEGKRSKYKGQLMDVKTNKEYSAMLHEIEGVEREIRSREDRILEEMERAEGLADEVKREETAFKEVETRHQAEVRSLDERASVLARERESSAAERDAVAATLSEEALTLFQRVARLRGAAVAEVRDGMCQLCNMFLQPQMYVDLKRNEHIVQCPACSRILYYVPTAPAASPGA